jgi:NAD(P)-dependent dehydrogenase (short-subunit alcohol dehydrogenase family)
MVLHMMRKFLSSQKNGGYQLGKFGTSQDFGDFVAMFCSEQATYVIGQSLVIDGGIDNTTF